MNTNSAAFQEARAQWEMAMLAIQHSNRVLLSGPPGTGKSWLATNAKHGEKVYSVTLTEEMSDSTLLGFYMPQGDKFVWHDGLLITAAKEGARMVVNEIDHASPACQSILHSLLDDEQVFRMTLPNGETLSNLSYTAIATMNGCADDLRPAIKDRFPIHVEITYPNPAAVALLPEYIQPLAINSSNYDQNLNISLRSWFEFLKMEKATNTLKACKMIWGQRHADIYNSICLQKQAMKVGKG